MKKDQTPKQVKRAEEIHARFHEYAQKREEMRKKQVSDKKSR